MVKQPGPPEVLELVHDWLVPQLRDGEVSKAYPECIETHHASYLTWVHAICFELCVDDPAILHQGDENDSRYMHNRRLGSMFCRSWFANRVPV